MAMTASDIIAASLRIIGIIASGQAPNANEQNDGLQTLNRLIDSWSNENLLIPNKVREVFPLINNQQIYTMGSGGDFNTSRPIKIENALIQLTNNTPYLELEMDILTKDEYAAIILKTLTSTFPLYVYPDNNFPLNNLSVWPVPNTSSNNIVLYSWKPLADLSTISTQVSLPPGYERAFVFNLAKELSFEYGRTLSQDLKDVADDSKLAIKRSNFVPQFLRVDKEIMAQPAVWNWRTGEPT